MRKYETYKDSGVDWIGEIPNNWTIASLRFLTNYVKTGSTPPTENQAYYEKGNIPWFGPADFNSLTLNNAKKQVTQKAIEDGKCRLFDKKSILLIGIGATVGKVAITKTICSANQQINAISFDESKMYPLFALYFLNSIKNIIVSEADSSTLPIFNQTQTKGLRLVKPSLKEQTQIANYLDHKTAIIDTLIDKKEQLLKKLQAQRQAIINEAVTKGLNKNAKMKNSGIEWLGEINSKWSIKKIKHTTYVKGRIGWQGLRAEDFREVGPYLVTGTDFVKGRIKWETCHRVEEERYEVDPKIQLLDDDVLITKDGTIGKIAIVKGKPQKVTLNTGVFVTRPLKNDYLQDYFFWLLTSEVFTHFIDFNKSGATIQHLYQNVFYEFSFALPKDLKEQKEIVDYLEFQTTKMNVVLEKTNSQIKKLKGYRQSIISEAVTGKIDVRDWQERK